MRSCWVGCGRHTNSANDRRPCSGASEWASGTGGWAPGLSNSGGGPTIRLQRAYAGGQTNGARRFNIWADCQSAADCKSAPQLFTAPALRNRLLQPPAR